jgi:hypothetical protein
MSVRNKTLRRTAIGQAISRVLNNMRASKRDSTGANVSNIVKNESVEPALETRDGCLVHWLHKGCQYLSRYLDLKHLIDGEFLTDCPIELIA